MTMKSKRHSLALLLSGTLFLSTVLGQPASDKKVKAADYGLSNPVINSEGVTTWDCVYFGNYYQSSETVKEPIKWRVLSVDGDDAFLLADQNLECLGYNTTYAVDVTWENCTLRSWLNGYGSDSSVEETDYSGNSFLDTAFTPAEQSAIRSVLVVNDDNPTWGTSGGNNTYDKCYLLSIAETCNTAYGFCSDFYEGSETRIVLNTAHVAAANSFMSSAGDADYWWLRSPGYYFGTASNIYYNGSGYDDGYSVGSGGNAVRPALHLNISSSAWTKAGQVKSTGDSMPVTPGATMTPNPSSSPKATALPGAPDKTPAPSAKPKKQKNSPTILNIKNKKSYSVNKKLTIKDADGIQSIKLNGVKIKVKKGKKSFSFKLSRYKKKLRKKRKWNKLVVTDIKRKKKTVQFKVK